ncbi:Fic family protein [Francisella philomiragia]|uniref:Fic/DOC family protein n=1 Tax=Francisella philomiragia TaxID=28110 RepID=UPI0019052AC5|nr:Fic family protein [Francisella philomiragia]MBK2341714.1 Fic family protein [Francisella philomiragia]
MAKNNYDSQTYINSSGYDTNVLRNKLEIKNQEQLSQIENRFFEINKDKAINIKGNFDFQHLKDIQKQLFGDLYEWAGTPREINIDKGIPHCQPHLIESELSKYLKRINQIKIDENNPRQILAKAAEYFGDIHSVHPFRDCNTRTNQTFCNSFLNQYGLKIKWSELDRHDLMIAKVFCHHGDNSKILSLMEKNSTYFGKELEKQKDILKIVNDNNKKIETLEKQTSTLIQKHGLPIPQILSKTFENKQQEIKNLNTQQEGLVKEFNLKKDFLPKEIRLSDNFRQAQKISNNYTISISGIKI